MSDYIDSYKERDLSAISAFALKELHIADL